ncbi:MAG TPA: UDP-2,3-diacylglucosamine diphosphatase LpxI [Bryobacterales bacterium]|nr:UDP-2,3-diacylglucosamine diphosphatase LpxI [Bryobacterales bacterium]
MKYALIAGNGRFPLLALEAARGAGQDMVVVAVKEEADPEIERLAAGLESRCHWISLGELSRLLEILKQEKVTHAVMAGQIQHKQIFSSIRPDWRLLKLLLALPAKNTDALLGAVAGVLAEEGVELVDSTTFLEPFLAPEGRLTARGPDEREAADIAYGHQVARALAAFDIGQSVIICDRACVAVEAMEGTDAAMLRAAQYSNGRPLTVVKVSKPHQDMRFDVPVIGPRTIASMQQAGATALAIDAGRTLLLDRDELVPSADRAGVAIAGYKP